MHQHCLKPFNGGMAARLHSFLPESQQFLINRSVEGSLEEEEALCGALGITLAESTPIKKAVLIQAKIVSRQHYIDTLSAIVTLSANLDVVSFNSLFNGFGKRKMLMEVSVYMSPNVVTWIDAFCKSGELDLALKYFLTW
ncbi:hypothetical protein Bca4012_060399 [Brassica carinata]